MARYSKKSQYKQIEDRVIYSLHSPVGNDCYIGHCRKDLLRDVYKDHLRGERYKTEKAVSDCKARGLRPCLHILEEISATKVSAYRHVIAWTKILTERGYAGLDKGEVECYMEDMLDHTRSVYEQYKNTNVSKMMACRRCFVRIYGRKLCVSYEEDRNEHSNDSN